MFSLEVLLTLDSRSDLRFRDGVEGEAGGDAAVIVLMQGQMQVYRSNKGCKEARIM